MNIFFLLCIFLSFVACSKDFKSFDGVVDTPNVDNSEDEPSPPPPPPSEEEPNVDSIDEKLFICSTLDFVGMTPPSDLTDQEINMFALALNISASFEGRQGWKNITNNFDGMGLSLGLLNQTLGTGSLQPLLIKMIEKKEAVMKAQYTAVNYTSIKKMALDWKKDTGFVVQKNEDLFRSDDIPYNDLDVGEILQILGAAETKSVNWAKVELYMDANGRNFKPDWKSQLQSMAGTKEYRDLQFEAARKLHNKASGYVDTFALKEIRSYLFMFDIVVQNGGFYQKNFDDFRSFMAKNPNATETQKLKAILDSRLVQVRSQFREDVKSRKEGLINGKGRVHQTNRDFEKEYCYKSLDVII